MHIHLLHTDDLMMNANVIFTQHFLVHKATFKGKPHIMEDKYTEWPF